VEGVASGNYDVRGVLDDHWPDGGGGNISISKARGVIPLNRPGENVAPALLFTQPDGLADQVDSYFRLRWVDSDRDDNATIRLSLRRAFRPNDAPILPAEAIQADDGENAFDVDMSGAVDLEDYEVVAEIDDGRHPVWRSSAVARQRRAPKAQSSAS